MELYLIALIVSFAVAIVMAPLMITKLRKMKYGQKILEDGPTWHMSKQYTPTMGGWIFIFSTVVAVIGAAVWENTLNLQNTNLLILAFAVVFGLIGCVDDMTKIKKKQNEGLTPLQKLLLQIAAAALFVSALRMLGCIKPEIYVPFLKIFLSVPWGVYLCFGIFVIVGTVNAVNLTDGIDGLATAVTMTVTAFFLIFYIANGHAPQAFAGALLGGLLAFFLFNRHPAKVFMGDTGALFLGGAVAGMAFAANLPLLLIPVGLVYIAETLSDILQVGYYKLSGGKRIFKMAPLHHHLELCGWSENKIVGIFTALTAAMCVLTYYAG